LLAMDQVEARTVVDQFLKSQSLVELYDSVLMPALNMAEQDRHRGAIDKTREEFLFLSVNEMVAEFSAYQPLPDTAAAEHAIVGEDENVAPHELNQHGDRRIFCVPAHDEADEIAAAMLAQVLEQDGYAALAFPTGPSIHDAIAMMAPGTTDVICISALPPYAFAPARAVCKQLRARYPKRIILACVWGFEGDVEKAKARFERAQPNELVTSIRQTIDLLHNLDLPKGGATSGPAAANGEVSQDTNSDLVPQLRANN